MATYRVLTHGGAKVTDWRDVAERRNLKREVDLLVSEPRMMETDAFKIFLERNKGLNPYSFLYVADHISKVRSTNCEGKRHESES